MNCVSCGRDVPDGRFCTFCGADQLLSSKQAGFSHRAERFAAHPDEAVLQPGLLTSLLPHLDHDRIDEFRWALLAGLGVVLLLYVAGLITAAILTAALLVPLLYVLYLYEIRTYRDAPARVFGFTMGLGALVGIVITMLGNTLRGPRPPITASPLGIDVDVAALVLVGLGIPLVQEVTKPLPALLLRRAPQFGQTIDGLVFGVAAGLGFALAQTIVQFGEVFATLEVREDPEGWIFPLLTYAVLLPVLHGSSTGIITAALWRGRTVFGRFQVGAIVAAVLAQAGFAIGSQFLSAAGSGPLIVLAWQALLGGVLLVTLRYLLHVALIEEASAFGLARMRCSNCGETSTAVGFCPACGMAYAASADRMPVARADGPDTTVPVSR